MIYKFDLSLLKYLCKHQSEEFLAVFKDYPIENNHLCIEYSDKNYTCLDKLPSVLNSKIQAIGFFSGAGGLDIGTQLAGAKLISSMDFDKDCVETMKANPFFSHTKHLCEDIRNQTGKDYDEILKCNNPEKLILVGGPPCQPFSKAGYWVTNEHRQGINDDRNMVGEYLRIIDEIRPDGFILENVESILHPTNRPVVEYIENHIQKMNYSYIRIWANCVDYGIPQRRKRVLFLATRKTIDSAPPIIKDKDVNVLDWIGKYDYESYSEIEEKIDGKTYSEELKSVPAGRNYIALSARDNYPSPKFIANKRFWNFLLKLHPLQPSWTIAAQPGPWVGPFHWNNRRLRIPEIAAIQTFPQDYIFVGSRRSIQKQIGNAVPSLLAKQFVEHLIKHI